MTAEKAKWTLSHRLALALFLSWLIGSVVLAWHYFYVPFVPFTEDLKDAKLLEMKLKRESNGLVALHFIDPDCTCNRYSQAHIENLKAAYASLEHHDVFPGTEGDFIRLADVLPASPSVALFKPGGELLYYGPYNGGAVCGEGFDFFKEALEEVSLDVTHDDSGPWVNLLQYGCYCAWPGK